MKYKIIRFYEPIYGHLICLEVTYKGESYRSALQYKPENLRDWFNKMKVILNRFIVEDAKKLISG